MFAHDLRMLDTTLADLAFPWWAAVQVEKVSDGERGAHVLARTIAAYATCPGCGTASPRVHARYQRRWRIYRPVAAG
jgi:hypothetical protein